MFDEGITNFFKELGVDAESDIMALYISMFMKAKQMGEYSEGEFMTGCKELGCDSIAAWKAKVVELRK
jgi:hypothetical protein